MGVRTGVSGHPLFIAQKKMRTFLIPLLLLCGLAQAAELPPAEQASAKELAQANGCLSCHALKEKVVGPAYASVAAKYKADADAPSSLVQSVQYGSKGKWGRIPMPAHPSMSVEDIKTLVNWVLTIQ
jgi:cytochrome c